MDESVLGGEVQELNKLTIITDFSFGEYVKALQAGLSEVLADRPRKVEPQLFFGKHRLTRAHREKQLKMSCQALHNAPPNRT